MNILTVDNFAANSSGARKRRRVIRSCSNCRARKVKCDQTKPICNSCINQRIPDCQYEPSPFMSENLSQKNEILNQENENLKKQIKYLQEKAVTADSNIGPKVEKRIQSSQFQFIFKKTNRTVFFGLTSVRALQSYGNEESKQFSMLKSAIKALRNEWKKDKFKSSHLQIMADLDSNNLLQILSNYLPKYEVIEKYINEFFDGVWFKIFPVLDKEVFMNDFKRIFVVDENNPSKIKFLISFKSSDFARIALVLVVLKYVLCSKFQRTFSEKDEFDDSDEVLFGCIHHLLLKARFLERITVPTLQCVFLLRLLKKFNVKDGDGGDNSNGSVLFGLCFEMAITLGLHQDIDLLYASETQSYKTSLKQLWKVVLYYDAVNSLDLGVPLHIADDNFYMGNADFTEIDTKTTFYLRGIATKLTKSSITDFEVFEIIQSVKNFLSENFEPIFTLINKLRHESTSETFEICKTISLMLPFLNIIQQLYMIIYRFGNGNNEQVESNSYLLTAKYSLLLSIASVEVMQSVEMMKQKCILAASVLDQVMAFVIGATKTSLIRGQMVLFSLFYISSQIDKTKKTIPKSTTDVLILNLSELQESTNDDFNISHSLKAMFYNPKFFRFMATKVINKIITIQNGSKAENKASILKYDDYGIFIMICMMKYFNNSLAKDDHDSSDINNSDYHINDKKFLVNYDVFDDPNLTINSFSPSSDEFSIAPSYFDDISTLLEMNKLETDFNFEDCWNESSFINDIWKFL
ncbi:hypothetical protein PACTADRAFT_33549 [Pachysolen tannophilus NRRL Y-2460]|uniref:Zn(2)-C6 fungal-type domain-containing protein n=1 Tax=Pachysolen tannophilus NRRL Y-2460 TaxID=669874 RepID=A0A1E4TXA4_PACTA|nr:hypothetical protein PACTADRAFT_33549 [Pachysolen tannophilus NRRL Y-2460]